MKDEQVGVAKLTTLTEEEAREFWRLYRLYWREAERCEEAKAYLAGCVMLGSALEALLILMVDVYDEQAAATGRVPMKGKKPKPLLDWDLGKLLRVAKAAGWLPAKLDPDKDDWDGRKAKVGDYAEVARVVRNLAHPGDSLLCPADQIGHFGDCSAVSRMGPMPATLWR